MEFPPPTRTRPNSTFTTPRSNAGRDDGNKPPFWLFLLILGLAGCLVYNYSRYEEVVTTDPDGSPALTPERQAEIAGRQKKNAEEAEQYILIAVAPGYRECYLCPEGKAWLETNEIAKIGVSTDGQGRYSSAFYVTHGVDYIMEYRGDVTTAKNRELARLGGFPLLPENQKRQRKLLYPPLNSKLD